MPKTSALFSVCTSCLLCQKLSWTRTLWLVSFSSLCPSSPPVLLLLCFPSPLNSVAFFCISRSEECLQSSHLHGVQPAASPPEAGDSTETARPLQLCVYQLQHLPSVHERPAASNASFVVHARLLVQLQRRSHLLLRWRQHRFIDAL